MRAYYNSDQIGYIVQRLQREYDELQDRLYEIDDEFGDEWYELNRELEAKGKELREWEDRYR